MSTVDIDTALAVVAAAAAHDGADPIDEATTMALRDGAAHAHGDARGVTLWVGDDLTLVVHPEHRGQGLGAALLTAATTGRTGAATAWSHGNHPAAAALAHSYGWQRTRDLWVMRRPSTDLPALDVASGTTVRGFRDADAEDVVAINAAAFAHHPEQGAMDLAQFARRRQEDWWDPAGLLVAELDGELAGFHWTKIHPGPVGVGEVYVVGIAPHAQGRGLGRLLTLAGLHHLAGRGVGEVILYVESDNAAAIHTYERLGFTHSDVDTHVQYSLA